MTAINPPTMQALRQDKMIASTLIYVQSDNGHN
ncbi:Uncharacterised protein [Edwardsiella tarda]|nr:Uncharacterised protein [Edwardsiella tarda]STD46314.1 Uncharacterised protein [Edwardsiella tarda]